MAADGQIGMNDGNGLNGLNVQNDHTILNCLKDQKGQRNLNGLRNQNGLTDLILLSRNSLNSQSDRTFRTF